MPANAFHFRSDDPRPEARGDAIYFTLGAEFNTESSDLFTRVLTGLQDRRTRSSSPSASRWTLPHSARGLRTSGSVLGALAHGLPSVLLPMGADQPHNARRIAALGAGVVLDPVTAGPADIRCAVTEVLDDPRYRQAAGRVRAEYNALPGPEATVPLLERL